jgi:hypothetical protein
MILYHFTALAHLIGEEGLVKARAASSSEGIDCGAFAAAGSILKSGLMPQATMTGYWESRCRLAFG